MKIVLIGGGSFVFAPTVLEDFIVKQGLSEGELVLVDLNEEVVVAMAEAGRRIADDLDIDIGIHSVVDRIVTSFYHN